MTKYISTTDTAKIIRAELKKQFPGQKFSVTSDKYSGGSSVDIRWTDGPTHNEVDAIATKFEGADFDGSNDSMNYHKSEWEGEEVRFMADFVHCTRSYSAGFLRVTAEMVAIRHGVEVPEIKEYNDGTGYVNSSVVIPGERDDLSMLINRECGSISLYAPIEKSSPQKVEHLTISRNKKKDGIEMRFPEKPNSSILALLNTSEFKYSRRQNMWYAKYSEKNWSFATGIKEYMKDHPEGLTPLPNSQTPTEAKDEINHDLADKLEALGDALEPQIQDKVYSRRLENTSRRQRIASGVRADGYKLQQIQSCCYALAESHRNGDFAAGMKPEPLSKVSARTEIITLLRGCDHNWNCTRRDAPAFLSPDSWDLDSVTRCRRIGIHDATEFYRCQDALKNMVEWHEKELIKEREQRERLKELDNRIKPGSVPGFFPTSKEIIEIMLSHADIQPGEVICEPSAGKGDLAEAIRDRFPDNRLWVNEINVSLREILKAKGFEYLPNWSNWLEVETDAMDVIIQNPPWGKDVDSDNLDIHHIRHSYKIAKRLVISLASAGVKFRSDRKYQAFRTWLDSVGGEMIDLPAFNLQESGTASNAVLIVIRKKAVAVQETNTGQSDLSWLFTETPIEVDSDRVASLLAETPV